MVNVTTETVEQCRFPEISVTNKQDLSQCKMIQQKPELPKSQPLTISGLAQTGSIQTDKMGDNSFPSDTELSTLVGENQEYEKLVRVLFAGSVGNGVTVKEARSYTRNEFVALFARRNDPGVEAKLSGWIKEVISSEGTNLGRRLRHDPVSCVVAAFSSRIVPPVREVVPFVSQKTRQKQNFLSLAFSGSIVQQNLCCCSLLPYEEKDCQRCSLIISIN